MTPPEDANRSAAAEDASGPPAVARPAWRPLRSLRRAIAAWFVLVLVLTTAGFGATLCWYYRKSLNDEADAELQGHATALAPAVMRVQMEERRRAFERARAEARARALRENPERDREDREDREDDGERGPRREPERRELERREGPRDGEERREPERREPPSPRVGEERRDFEERRQFGPPNEPRGAGEPEPPRPPVPTRDEPRPPEGETPLRELPLGAIEAESFRRSRGSPYYVVWHAGRMIARSDSAPLEVPFPTEAVERLQRERLAAAGVVASSNSRGRGERFGGRERESEASANPPRGEENVGDGPPFGRGPNGGGPGPRRGPGPPDFRDQRRPSVARSFPRDQYRELAVVYSEDDVLLVGRSMELEERRFTGFIGVVALAGVGAVAIAASGGWLLASLALRPIASMTHAAAEISERNLRNRLDVASAPSEMQDLAATINGAFDRLEDAFGRLRKFTADASHELRTPLAIASSHVQLALSRERSPEEYRKTLTTCRSALDRMARLVESLLTLARLDAEPTRVVSGSCDLNRLAGEAVALLRPLAEEHSTAIDGPDPAAAPLVVSADPDRILQVILNLAGNAIYYNRPSGRVSVTATRENDHATLRVSDQGEGISLEDQPRIFERFFRADKSRSRRRGGAGLGLSIAKRIVELHGGEIGFESRVGEGTTFFVRLPLAPVAPAATESPASDEPRGAGADASVSASLDA